MTTTTDDRNVTYRWHEWTVSYRAEGESRPWFVMQWDRRVARFKSSTVARTNAERFIREDNGEQTAIRWTKTTQAAAPPSSSSVPPPAADPSTSSIVEAGQHLLHALHDFIAECRKVTP